MPIIPNTLAEIARISKDNKGVLTLPLSHDLFSFDSFGIASFFGGDNALAGMATLTLIPSRRWLGWYNIPGSLEIAKQYARLAKLKISDALFPDGDRDPARLFKLDSRVGPKFVGAHSGVILDHTGHPGSLLLRKVKTMKVERTFDGTNGNIETGQNIIVVNFKPNPDRADDKTQGNTKSDPEAQQHGMEMPISFPKLPVSQNVAWSLLPMSASIGTCILCALVRDWFCFASIAVGIVAHGFACLVISSGQLTFESPAPADGALSGDGVLKGNRDLVILVGSGDKVNAITRGRFFLQYGSNKLGDSPSSEDDPSSTVGETQDEVPEKATDQAKGLRSPLTSPVIPSQQPTLSTPSTLSAQSHNAPDQRRDSTEDDQCRKSQTQHGEQCGTDQEMETMANQPEDLSPHTMPHLSLLTPTSSESPTFPSSVSSGHSLQSKRCSPPTSPSQPSQPSPSASLPPILRAWRSLLSYFIWISALLLMAQPIIQLFLIPLGTLFGQVMFITSILASWMYNIYLSYHVGRDDIQTQILFQTLGLEDHHIRKYRLCTWTSTIAFTCFLLDLKETLDNPLSFLNAMLPSNTPVWKVWKREMVAVLRAGKYFNEKNQLVFKVAADADLSNVEEKHRKLLEALFQDTQDGWNAWAKVDKSYMVTPLEIEDEAKNSLSCLIQ